jgi:hypothetical protein
MEVPPVASTNPALVVGRRIAPSAPKKQMPRKSRLTQAESNNMKNYENYVNVWTVKNVGPINVGDKNNKSASAKNISWANRSVSVKKGGKRKTVRRSKK